jgi:hypothetical protein
MNAKWRSDEQIRKFRKIVFRLFGFCHCSVIRQSCFVILLLSHKSNIKNFDASARAAAGWQTYEMSQLCSQNSSDGAASRYHCDRLGADDD